MNIHELKLLLQQHLTDGLVTVIGSGLSCAEGLPGMGELANYLSGTVMIGLAAADIDRWNMILPLLPTRGLEAALLEVPPTRGLEIAIVERTVELIAKRERQIVAEIFSRTRTLRFTRLVKHLLKPSSGLTVITTNYDRLAEIALEEADLGIDTLFVGHFVGKLSEQESRLSFCREVTLKAKRVQYHYRPHAKVLKPHGSLDWYHRDGKPVRYYGDLDLPRLIITPGLNKFRNGYESPFDRHRERANSAIDHAGRFLIIGYGFNDDHLETHLTPQIRSGIPTLLLTYKLSDNALKLVKECHNVTAIQQAEKMGTLGSSVFVAGVETFFPDLSLWDLNSFVTEVLEP